MTILNAFITADRALVAVDTVGRHLASGERIDGITKIVPLSGIHAVIACRGDVMFFATVVGSFLMASVSLEGVAEVLARSAQEQLAGAIAAARKLDPEADAGGRAEVLLVGWSRLQSRIRAWEFNVTPEACASREIAGAYVSPSDGWDGTDPDSEEKMSSLARRQMAWMAENTPDLVTGGNLTVTELSAARIAIWRGVSL